VNDDAPPETPEPDGAAARRLPLDFRIAMTLMVAVLAAAVIVLALIDNGGGTKTVTSTTVVTKTVRDPALARQVSGLAGRVAAVDRTQAALGKTVAGLAKNVKALNARIAAVAVQLQHARPAPSGNTKLQAQLQTQFRTLSAQLQTVNTCLFQLQKQLDDIQAYGLTRSALKKRVSGTCVGILQPRYAGP
jgi:hypothetical protein